MSIGLWGSNWLSKIDNLMYLGDSNIHLQFSLVLHIGCDTNHLLFVMQKPNMTIVTFVSLCYTILRYTALARVQWSKSIILCEKRNDSVVAIKHSFRVDDIIVE